MMKSLSVRFLSVLFFAIISLGTAALANESSLATKNVLPTINQVIEKVYKNEYLGESNDLSEFMSTPILSYLEEKASAKQYSTNLYRIEKENYAVTVKLIERTAVDSLEKFQFQVITTFNYVGSPADDLSTKSESVTIIYDYESGLIVDFHCPYNDYDRTMRGQDPLQCKGLDSIQAFQRTQEIVAKQDALIGDIDHMYQLEQEESAKRNIFSPKASFNFGNIASYARNNYDKNQPASGNGVVPYYDFGEIAFDCTNFVSHAMLAGGANVYDTGGSGISSTGWYYGRVE